MHYKSEQRVGGRDRERRGKEEEGRGREVGWKEGRGGEGREEGRRAPLE